MPRVRMNPTYLAVVDNVNKSHSIVAKVTSVVHIIRPMMSNLIKHQVVRRLPNLAMADPVHAHQILSAYNFIIWLSKDVLCRSCVGMGLTLI